MKPEQNPEARRLNTLQKLHHCVIYTLLSNSGGKKQNGCLRCEIEPAGKVRLPHMCLFKNTAENDITINVLREVAAYFFVLKF